MCKHLTLSLNQGCWSKETRWQAKDLAAALQVRGKPSFRPQQRLSLSKDKTGNCLGPPKLIDLTGLTAQSFVLCKFLITFIFICLIVLEVSGRPTRAVSQWRLKTLWFLHFIDFFQVNSVCPSIYSGPWSSLSGVDMGGPSLRGDNWGISTKQISTVNWSRLPTGTHSNIENAHLFIEQKDCELEATARFSEAEGSARGKTRIPDSHSRRHN